MLNQQIIRDLFKISPDENIFDDFGCTHEMKPGKLYVLENHLCFYSDLIGETKLIFSFDQIDTLVKVKSTIEVKVGTKLYKFSGFSDPQLAYQYIRTSWIGCCPDKDTEEPPQPEPEPLAGKDSLSQHKSVEAKRNPSKDSKTPSNKSAEQKIPEESKEKSSSIQVPLIEMEDENYIRKSLEKYPKKENEVMRVIFPFTAEEYQKRFLAVGCPFPDIKLFEVIGSKEIEDKGWEPVEGKADCKKRTLIMQYKLAGNMFLSFAYTIKDTVMTCSENTLKLETVTNTPKAPFGTCFNVQDSWEVLPLDEPSVSVLIICMKVEFVKSTMFKGKIQSSSIEEYKRFCNLWIKEVKKRNLHYPLGYVPPSAGKSEVKKTELQHNIEKAYGVKLKAPATTGSLDDLWNDTRDMAKKYWYIIVIIVLAYLLHFYFKYIVGLNAKLDQLEKDVKFLVSMCLNNSTFTH